MGSPQPGNTPQTFGNDWARNMPTTPEPISPRCSPHQSPKIYSLSPDFTHLVESPDQFRPVLRDRIARLQNSLPQLSAERLRQAKADITFLRSVLENEGLNIAQVRAGAVYSARV